MEEYVRKNSYHFLYHDSLIGLYICIFVSSRLKGRISNVQGDSIEVGGISKLKFGNKGALITRFKIDSTSVTLINAHLRSGQDESKYEKRMNSIERIHNHAFKQKHKLGEKSFKNIDISDYKFLFGDLNFRNSFSRKAMNQYISQYRGFKEKGDERGCTEVLQKI